MNKENNIQILNSNDWRRQGQEKYLKGVILELKNYSQYREGWEHDHCEFCGSKFSLNEGDLQRGYVTKDNYRWICSNCFNDFKDEFVWKIED